MGKVRIEESCSRVLWLGSFLLLTFFLATSAYDIYTYSNRTYKADIRDSVEITRSHIKISTPLYNVPPIQYLLTTLYSFFTVVSAETVHCMMFFFPFSF